MILVVGSTGMLGRELVRELQMRAWPHLAPDHQEFDICNDLLVYRYMARHRPSIVINLAAMTNVDACEEFPEIARQVNGDAVGRLASHCEKYKSKFIQISTDYVFDGRKTAPYFEDEPAFPVNRYGESKLIGEKMAVDSGGIVLRLQWLYGYFRPNFVDYIIHACHSQNRMQVLTNQFSTPCSAQWLAYMISDIAHRLATPGIYHLTHDDYVSRHECAEYIVKGFGLHPDEVLIPCEEIKTWVAKRPLYTVLNNSKLKKTMGIERLGSWQTDIREYIAMKYKRRLYED